MSGFNPTNSHIRRGGGGSFLWHFLIHRMKYLANLYYYLYVLVKSNLSERHWLTTTLLTDDDIVQCSQNCFIFGPIARYSPIHVAFPYPTFRHPVSKKVFFSSQCGLIEQFYASTPHRANLCLFKGCKKCYKITSKGGGVGEGGGRTLGRVFSN